MPFYQKCARMTTTSTMPSISDDVSTNPWALIPPNETWHMKYIQLRHTREQGKLWQDLHNEIDFKNTQQNWPNIALHHWDPLCPCQYNAMSLYLYATNKHPLNGCRDFKCKWLCLYHMVYGIHKLLIELHHSVNAVLHLWKIISISHAYFPITIYELCLEEYIRVWIAYKECGVVADSGDFYGVLYSGLSLNTQSKDKRKITLFNEWS